MNALPTEVVGKLNAIWIDVEEDTKEGHGTHWDRHDLAKNVKFIKDIQEVVFLINYSNFSLE